MADENVPSHVVVTEFRTSVRVDEPPVIEVHGPYILRHARSVERDIRREFSTPMMRTQICKLTEPVG